MNFFEHQDRARGTTRKLVLLFGAAVASLIIITTMLVVAAFSVAQNQSPQTGFELSTMRIEILAGVSALVIVVVMLGAGFRMTQLHGGGKAVAESLGGRLLNLSTRDADERKILNVVEEMSIAAGLPVPCVYLMEDPAINAFAAGFEPRDAVIGVTRGCIQLLSRDELQGVIAHEFSHIFNGDMRLNIRLIGWLYGITVIGMIGYFMMRGQTYHHLARSNRNSKTGGLMWLGLGLIVVGYGGTFFGNLIKAAVSRQREFLADASAVQFTRNPESIGGALKKIGGLSQGSVLSKVDASEVSHMLFSAGIKAGLTGLFATHPPLEERIRRIEPGWDGKFVVPTPGQAARAAHGASAGGSANSQQMSQLIDHAGDPGTEQLQAAAEQLSVIPVPVVQAIHTTLGACLTMHALIISSAEAEVASKQRALLQDSLSAGNYRELDVLIAELSSLPRSLYMPLVELSLPGLKQLSTSQFRVFMTHLHQLMQADGHISLFEWCLFKILRHQLDPHGAMATGSKKIAKLEAAVGQLFSALASAGADSEQQAEAAFNCGIAALGKDYAAVFHFQTYPDLQVLDQAFDALRHLQALQKPLLLKAMVRCVEQDDKVTPDEVELIRVAAAILDCPLPPLTIAVS